MSEQPSEPRPHSHRTSHRPSHRPSRRHVLVAGATTLTAATLGATAFGSPAAAAPTATRGARLARGLRQDPFTLGVASGDPLPDGVVLWTRLASDPLALDGHGGMPGKNVPVAWQVATDERFRDVVASGAQVARPEAAHSVHVELAGLRPGADYFYRFRAGTHVSPTGHTRTAPALGSSPQRFAFAFASCQNYPSGFYNAYANMADDDLDLVAFLGDYIYEGGAQGSLGRGHLPDTEIWSLADYRVRHAQYRSDADLQTAHAAFPWAVVFDDHEVENNWADDRSQEDGEEDADPAVFLQRRARAFQAYYEHMPLRRAQRPNGPDVQMYRRLRFGDLVEMSLLDTRQYRSDQVEDARRDDPSRTILGRRQRDWLESGLAASSARWNILAQQVFFSQRDFADGKETVYSNDAWDNYQVERDAVRDALGSSGAANPVVVTGDVHASYVNDVLADFDDPGSRAVATELVGTSISSGGDGVDQNSGDEVQLEQNPHIRFINRKRGYVRNVVTRGEWTADFRIVDHVTSRGAPASTRATFVVEDGRAGARRA